MRLYQIFIIISLAIGAWYFVSLCTSVNIVGKTKDGSTFTYSGIFVKPLTFNSDYWTKKIEENIIKFGKWERSPFAKRYNIHPTIGQLSYFETDTQYAWFPVQWTTSGPTLDWTSNIANQYNEDNSYRQKISLMKDLDVIECFNEGGKIK